MAHSDLDQQSMSGTDVRRALDHGDVVVDRDRGDSRAVVGSRPPVPAADWYVPERGNLAADNPSYPADDQVVCVVYRDTLADSYPYYSGVKPLALSAFNECGVQFYAFPESRLRAVGHINNHRIDLTAVHPSPYHARSFRAADNREFIERIRRCDDLATRPPLLRPIEDGFEIVNGHKRIWAAHVAGLSHVTARCIYSSDEEAARTFVNAHLDSYGLLECRKATQTIRQRFGTETAKEILS